MPSLGRMPAAGYDYNSVDGGSDGDHSDWRRGFGLVCNETRSGVLVPGVLKKGTGTDVPYYERENPLFVVGHEAECPLKVKLK